MACLVCVDIYKGNLTRREAERNLVETNEDHTIEELQKLEEFINEHRKDLLEPEELKND